MKPHSLTPQQLAILRGIEKGDYTHTDQFNGRGARSLDALSRKGVIALGKPEDYVKPVEDRWGRRIGGMPARRYPVAVNAMGLAILVTEGLR